MFRYKFFVDSRWSGGAVKLRLTNNRKKAEISTGIAMPESVLENALSPHPLSENIKWSRIFKLYVAKLENIRAEMQNDGNRDMDIGELKRIVASELGLLTADKTEPADLFMPYFISYGESKAKATFESFVYTQSTMRKFSGDVDSMRFDNVTYAWLSDFQTWMKQRGLSQNTRKIHFGNIRMAMREAYKRGLTDNDPFRRFTFRPEKTRKRALKVDDLRRLFSYPVEDYAVFYVDMFKLIFMFCGINTVDLFRLSGITDNGRIEYKRSKNGRLYSIKVEPEAMEIIEKYKGTKGLLCIADRWSDHRNFRHQLNKALQSIGMSQGKGKKRLVGQAVWPELTSYWARHTWGTIARSIGVSKDDISLALGHGSKNPVTDIYLDEDMGLIDNANRRVLDWVLYGKR